MVITFICSECKNEAKLEKEVDGNLTGYCNHCKKTVILRVGKMKS